VSEERRLPVIVLTGFLGSGKTTLLNQLVRDARFRNTAVLINEFGDVGLDHHLVQHSAERMVVLSGGCICCAMREDVEAALRELFERRDRGEIPAFERIVVETSGLADPVPLVLTLSTFGLAKARLRTARVIATADAVLGERTISDFEESVRQIAAADVVMLTKVDRADEQAVAKVRRRIESMNPWCDVVPVDGTSASGGYRLIEAVEGLEEAAGDNKTVWCHHPRATRLEWKASHLADGTPGSGRTAKSFAISLDEPLDWGAFGVWLTLLLHRHGERVLRVKGIANVAGLRAPVVCHAAQHMVHPPQHLERWPSEDRRSHIVFIVLGLDPDIIVRSLKAFNGLAAHLAETSSSPSVKPAGAGGTVMGRPVRRPTAPSWIRG
jgi:G3E family GTPase